MSKLNMRMKELERAQCTATSDPVAKEDITDVGDMEIESDSESQDSAPSSAPPATQVSRALPPVGITQAPPIARPAFQPQPSQQLPMSTALMAQPSGNSYPPRMPHPLSNAVPTPAAAASGPGGSGFPNVNVPPSSSLPPPSSQSYPPPPRPIPPQVPRQPPVSVFPQRATFPVVSNIPPGSNIPPRSMIPPGSNFPPQSNISPGSSIPPRSNIPPGSNVPPRSTIPSGANIPPRSNSAPGSNIPPRSNIPPGSNIPPRSNIPPGSTNPPMSNFPRGAGGPPRSTIPPNSNFSFAPPRTNVPPGSNVSHVSVGSNIHPRPSVPPGSNIPPGSSVSPRFQRPPFPPSSGVHTAPNVPPGGPRPVPANFNGPPMRPRFPPPQSGSPVNIRQPTPPQGGSPYNNARPHFPQPPSQTNTSPLTAPPTRLTTPTGANSIGPTPPTHSSTNPAQVMTSHPAPPTKSALEVTMEPERKTNVDLLTRSQTGLDQRLKNMVAQKMLGDMLNDYGSSSGSEPDEKPYSPASDEPEISISNTGTPKPDEEIDTDSVPTPDSGNVTPDDGGSPHINMNNPILQALYSSSPDATNRDEPPVSVSETTTLTSQPDLPATSDPVANIDTEYLQGILNTVKSSSLVKNEAVTPGPASSVTPGPASSVAPSPTSSSGMESALQATFATPQKQQGLASLKDIKITPTVTNLLGELFPQLSKTLQQSRKRKQEGAEEEGTAQKLQRMEEGQDIAPRMGANLSEMSKHNTVPQPHAPNVRGAPHPNHGPPQPDFRQPRPDLGPPGPGPIPRPMPRLGMPPPNRGPVHPESPRSRPPGPFPPRFRGPPPPSFRGPPPPRGPPSMMRYQAPPPSQFSGRPRAPYPLPPPGSSMGTNHSGPVAPGAFSHRAPGQYKQMVTPNQRPSGESSMTDPYRALPLPHPPRPGANSFRPSRYV